MANSINKNIIRRQLTNQIIVAKSIGKNISLWCKPIHIDWNVLDIFYICVDCENDFVLATQWCIRTSICINIK